MLDRLFFIALVLNASGLFRFVAPQLGVTIGHVSMVLLALNCLYLFVKVRMAGPILLRGAMGRWTLLLWIWPIATIVYAPSFELREVGLHLYYFTLFFSTVVFTRVNGLPAIHRMLTISLIITVIGMPLSMMAPQYFEAVAALADAKSEEMGRPIGFFMQPNRLAISLSLMFIAWYALKPNKSAVKEVVAIVCFLGLELLTGSRAGMLVGLGIVALMIVFNWPERFARGRLLYTGGLLLVCLVVGIVGLRIYLAAVADVGNRREGDLIDRMDSIVSFRFSLEGNLAEDESLEERVETQAHYIGLVLEHPLLGHGFGANAHYLETGSIWLSAHSEALSRAFDYGVIYPVFLYLAVASLYRKRGRRELELALGTNAVAQFAAAFAVLFAYSSVMEVRVTYIVLGIVYAAVQYPRQLFAYDEVSGHLGAMLTRHDLQLRTPPEKHSGKTQEVTPE